MTQRMNKVYYNCEIINQTANPIDAAYDVGLLKPILENPLLYNINVNRFRLPLNGVPLSRNNIPFEQWYVGLGYQTGSNGTVVYETAHVPQYNEVLDYNASYILAQTSTGGFQSITGDIRSNSYVIASQNDFTPSFSNKMLLSTMTKLATATYFGENLVEVYDENFTLITSFNTSTSYGSNQCIFLDPETKDIYVGMLKTLGLTILHYVYANNAWTVDASVYKAYAYVIEGQPNIYFLNNILYATDSLNSNIYYWTAKGDVTGTFKSAVGDTWYANQMTIDANSNLLVCLTPSLSTQTEDQLYYTDGNVIRKADGTIMTQGTIPGSFAITDTHAYGIGTNYNTYSVPVPLNPNNPWTNVDSTTDMAQLFVSFDKSTLYGLDTESNVMLWQNNAWMKIASNLQLATGVSILSVDTMEDNRLICVGSNTDVYIGNMPVQYIGYSFLCASNYNVNTVSFVTTGTNKTLQNNTANVSYGGATTDGTNFYVVNSNNMVDKYDSQFNYLTTFSMDEARAPKKRLFYAQQNNFIIVEEGDVLYRTFFIYDSNGTYKGEIFSSQSNKFASSVCEISANNVNYLAVIDNIDQVLNFYDPVSFNSSYGFSLTIPPSIENLLSMTYNPTNRTVSVLCGLDSGSSTIVNGTVVINFQFDTAFTNLTQLNTINAASNQTFKDVFYSTSTSQLFVLALASSPNTVQVLVFENDYTTFRTITLPSSITDVAFWVPTQFNSQISFKSVSCNVQSSSLCSSKQYPNRFYCIDALNQGIYAGYLSDAESNLQMFNLGLPTGTVYKHVFCDSVVIQPSGQIYSQLVSFNASYSQVSTTPLPGRDLDLLTVDKNKKTIYSIKGSNQLTVGNQSVSISGISHFLSYENGDPLILPSESYNLNSYQDFLNQINLAFASAFNKMTASYSSYAPSEAPRIVFNPQSRLFSLICRGDYLSSGTYTILMNNRLWNMFLFPSVTTQGAPTDINGLYKTVLVQNNINNVVYGSSATSPNYVSVNQESSTAFKFYDLVRIMVTTSKIPINGDIEGKNDTVNLITDIVPDTNTLTPDDVIIYQPTVLRNYNLDSNVPLKDINLQFYYGCKDGTVHKIKLLPNEYASVKIEFSQEADIV